MKLLDEYPTEYKKNDTIQAIEMSRNRASSNA
jgi:hypothetical protein